MPSLSASARLHCHHCGYVGMYTSAFCEKCLTAGHAPTLPCAECFSVNEITIRQPIGQAQAISLATFAVAFIRQALDNQERAELLRLTQGQRGN